MKRNAESPNGSHVSHPSDDDAVEPRQNQGQGLDLDGPQLTVAAVARIIAVAPATLRTWDRRYGLGPSVHQTGTHRRYGRQDLVRLSVMRLWIFRGATSSQAASYALDLDLASVDAQELQEELQAEIAKSAHADPDAAVAALTIATESQGATVTSINRLKLASPPPTNAWQERCSQLVARALRNDAQGCLDELRLTETTDLIQWWKRLVRPALERIDSHTVLASPGQSPRMTVSQAALSELERITRNVSSVPSGHPSRLRKMVLVFAPNNERLSLSAHVLTSALVKTEVNGHLVSGPDLPERVLELVALARPVAAVFVEDQQPPNVDLLEALVEKYPQLPIFIGLGGADPLPPSLRLPQVSRTRSFTGLFHEVVAVANSPTFGSDYWDEQSRLVSLGHLK